MQDVEMSVEGFNNVFSYVVLHLTNWWWCKMEMNIIIRHLTTYHSIPLNTSTMHHHINTIMAVPSKNFEMCTSTSVCTVVHSRYSGCSTGYGVVL